MSALLALLAMRAAAIPGPGKSGGAQIPQNRSLSEAKEMDQILAHHGVSWIKFIPGGIEATSSSMHISKIISM
jgi:enoyl reductase-like protein